MDVQNLLVRATKSLLKNKRLKIDVGVFKPTKENLFRYIVSIRANASGFVRTLSGSGNSRSLRMAYIKALGEFIEAYGMAENGFKDRSGMAAGFIFSESVRRAKCELIERDAFLYHYQKSIPFTDGFAFRGDLFAFELASATAERVVLVTDVETVRGKAVCLRFGVGAHQTFEGAQEKAIEEYSNIKFLHERFPKRCENWAKNPDIIPTVVDMHHAASRDGRNLERFSQLFKTCEHSRVKVAEENWSVTRLQSPVTGFCLVKVEHPNLKAIEFGMPEEGTENLFHPFW